MKQSALGSALASVLACSPPATSAATMEFNWSGNLVMLDPGGAALANNSITTKGANQYLTPVSGTMAYDTDTGAGIAAMTEFWLYNKYPPTTGTMKLQAIGDGMGGAGTLMMVNMLFNWGYNADIPASIVLDAAGFFGASSGMWGDGILDQADVAGHGAVPASDGTYLDSVWGYLNTGPVPMATTEWNLTRAPACGTSAGTCMGVATPGILPLLADTAVNSHEYLQGDGIGVGGVPMWDGPFASYNANFDFTSLTLTNPDAGYTIPVNSDFFGIVPVPAAVWLFGSGLLGLAGTGSRKRHFRPDGPVNTLSACRCD